MAGRREVAETARPGRPVGAPVRSTRQALSTERDAPRRSGEQLDAIAIDPYPGDPGPRPRRAVDERRQDVACARGVRRVERRLELARKLPGRRRRAQDEQPGDGRQRAGSDQIRRSERCRLLGRPADLLFEPSKLGVGLSGDEEVIRPTFEDDIDDATGGPNDRHLQVSPPDGMQAPKKHLDHPSLVPIRESRARARIEPNAEVGTECRGDRGECLDARVGGPGLDPGVVGPVDPRKVGDLALGRTGVGPHPQQVAADRTNGLAVSSPDRPFDSEASIRRWHGAIEPDGAYLPITRQRPAPSGSARVAPPRGQASRARREVAANQH